MMNDNLVNTIPALIKSGIKKKAESEWPGDFVMQLDMVEEQSHAYMSIENLKDKNRNYGDKLR